MFLLDLISDNIKSLAPLRRWPAGALIVLEFLISAAIAYALLNSQEVAFTDVVAGNILAAFSLFGSILIAAIIQLHSNIKAYSDENTVILRKSGLSQASTRQSEWAYKVMRSKAKILAAKFLFSNLMLNLVLAFATAAMLILFLLSKDGSSMRSLLDFLSLTLVIYFGFTNFRVVRRIYIFMNDDFSGANE